MKRLYIIYLEICPSNFSKNALQTFLKFAIFKISKNPLIFLIKNEHIRGKFKTLINKDDTLCK